MSAISRTNDAESARGALIERVVREVIARLHAGTAAGQSPVGRHNAGAGNASANDRANVATPYVDTSSAEVPVRITDRVVTAGTIGALPSSTRRIEVVSNAVVTPAARDEARNRGITLTHGWGGASTSTSPTNATSSATSTSTADPEGVTSVRGVTANPATARFGLRDRERPERGEAVRSQLERRGVTCGEHTTIVLSDHPAAATHEEASGGRRVATVRRLTDVDRFAAELGPECWVLDMIDLSPVAAVNAARRILQTASPPDDRPMPQ